MLQVLMLERVEPEQNIHRYYVLAVEPTLFGDMALRREWGRIGNRGGAQRLDFLPTPRKLARRLGLGSSASGGGGIRSSRHEVSGAEPPREAAESQAKIFCRRGNNLADWMLKKLPRPRPEGHSF